LQELTGLSLTPDKWAAWFSAHRPYLVWANRQNRFIVDEEAKQEEMPT